MGHSVTYMSFDENATKKQMSEARMRYIIGNGDYEDGILLSHDNGFILHDIVCDSYDDAVEKIADYDNGWYDDHGVKYYDYSCIKQTKQMTDLMKRKRELSEKKSEYIKTNSVKNRKSNTVTCPKCGSRLNISYLNGNSCPLCRMDLRSETVLNKIRWFDEKMKECDRKYAECEKKQKSKAKVKWLVKLEFHV